MSDEREVIRGHLQGRLSKYESALYTLLRDIRDLIPNVSRESTLAVSGKIELMAAAMERLIRSGGSSSAYDDLHMASDQLILLRAQLERKAREAAREEEDLEITQQRQRARQLRDEIERELGGGRGHGTGEG